MLNVLLNKLDYVSYTARLENTALRYTTLALRLCN